MIKEKRLYPLIGISDLLVVAPVSHFYDAQPTGLRGIRYIKRRWIKSKIDANVSPNPIQIGHAILAAVDRRKAFEIRFCHTESILHPKHGNQQASRGSNEIAAGSTSREQGAGSKEQGEGEGVRAGARAGVRARAGEGGGVMARLRWRNDSRYEVESEMCTVGGF